MTSVPARASAGPVAEALADRDDAEGAHLGAQQQRLLGAGQVRAGADRRRCPPRRGSRSCRPGPRVRCRRRGCWRVDGVDPGPRQRARGLRSRAVGVALRGVERRGTAVIGPVGHGDRRSRRPWSRTGPRRTASRSRCPAGRSGSAPRHPGTCPRRTAGELCRPGRAAHPGTPRARASGRPNAMPAPTTPRASTARVAKAAISRWSRVIARIGPVGPVSRRAVGLQEVERAGHQPASLDGLGEGVAGVGEQVERDPGREARGRARRPRGDRSSAGPGRAGSGPAGGRSTARCAGLGPARRRGRRPGRASGSVGMLRRRPARPAAARARRHAARERPVLVEVGVPARGGDDRTPDPAGRQTSRTDARTGRRRRTRTGRSVGRQLRCDAASSSVAEQGGACAASGPSAPPRDW